MSPPRSWLYNIFLRHPHEEGMTYGQHARFAWGMATLLLKGSVALFLHGVIPSTHVRTGSEAIQEACKRIERRKR